MSPLVSIIIPVYNTAPYLRRCLDSVLGQTFQNLEVICINDGSIDNSLDILNEYAELDNRVRVFSIAHAGPGKARNLALEHCHGVWVTGLDSDDYLEPDACSYVLDNEQEDVDVIQFGFRIKQHGDTETLTACLMKGKQAVTPHVLVSHSCEFCGKFWRKSFLDKNRCRFSEGVWYEDWFFYWAYIHLAKNILYLSECKYVIVQRSSSIMGMSRKHSERVLDHVRVLEKLLDFRLDHPLAEKFYQLNLINFVQCVRFADAYLPKECREQANEIFSRLSCHSLMKSWRKWVCDNSRCKFKRLFIKKSQGEIEMGLFGFFPLKVRVEFDMIVWRFFGVGVIRYKIRG